MRDKLLEMFYRLSVRWSKQALIVSACVTVLLGIFVPFLKVSNAHSDLVPASHPEQVKYIEFLKEFGAADNVVVVLDGEPDVLKAHADLFAREIEAEKIFIKSVFYRIDLDQLIRNAPLFMPPEQLQQATSFLSTNAAFVDIAAGIDDLPSLLNTMRMGMNGELPGIALAPTHAPHALEQVESFFGLWTRWIEDPSIDRLDPGEWLETVRPDEAAMLRSKGYLLSHDETMLFLFVQPLSSSDEEEHLRAMQSALRAACQRVFDAQPGLEDRMKVAFTGMPAHLLSEVEAIGGDVGRAGVVSVVLVVALLLFEFRSLKTMLLAVAPLACGMIMTLGAITLTIGRLNMVSSSFLAVLFGIGIDFAIYLLRRTEEELGNGKSRKEAVHIAVTVAGKGVLTGGLTTSLSFFAEGFSDFVGFSELGITAGIGILVVMVATFVMLPPLMLHIDIKPRVYDLSRTTDDKWLKSERRLLYPLVTLAMILAVIGLAVAPRISFDFNALHLLPPSSESTIYQLRMQDESDFQMTFAAVTADSLDELRSLENRMRKLPSVSRIDSLTRIVPSNQEIKIEPLRQCRELLADLNFTLSAGERSRDDYMAALNLLSDRLEDIQEDAFAAGHAAIVAAVDENLTTIGKIMQALSDNSTALERTRTFEVALFDKLSQAAELMRHWTALSPLEENDYSPGMIGRFKSSKGTYVSYVFPNGTIWDIDFLDRFVADLRAITPNVTGFPTTVPVHTRMAVNGLRQSLIYGLVVVVILLGFDFKKVRPVLLSLVPLTVGMLWVQAAFFFMGRDYNYASMAGLPLLLGLGIVYAVHIVHRWQENVHISAFAATMTSGRGVAFAALTTMAGLFSIVFARHRGVSDFGSIILLGIMACLLASLIVLPAIIDLLYLKPKKRRDNPDEN